jgi:hypothetical protein
MTIEAKKIGVVTRILAIDNNRVIDQIEALLNQLEKTKAEDLSDIQYYVGHIEAEVDIEKLRREQQVQPFDAEAFDYLVQEADFEEDIDTLLASVKSCP